MSQNISLNQLNNSWTLYYHDFDSIDWTINGYTKLLVINTVEDYSIMMNLVNDWNNGLYYLMRDPYVPIWEDPLNENGGGWTIKILKQNVSSTFYNITAHAIGETICNTLENSMNIVGISISPKTKFTTIRIWTKLSDGNIDNFTINFNETRFSLNKQI
jgi:hypothetical protein